MTGRRGRRGVLCREHALDARRGLDDEGLGGEAGGEDGVLLGGRRRRRREVLREAKGGFERVHSAKRSVSPVASLFDERKKRTFASLRRE